MATAKKFKTAPLGIIAGSGVMPLSVAAAARESGRPVHVVALQDAAEKGVEEYPHTWVNIGQLGRIFNSLKEHHCKQIVIVGGIKRPDLPKMRFDTGAVANIAELLRWTVGGDNSLLSGVVGFFESKGFEVIGAQELVPELLAPLGPVGKHQPSEDDLEDIRIGLEVVARLGELDIGQAAVVARKYVLAVEAAEGTDRMLERCKEVRPWGGTRRFRSRRGVLVKCAKPGQEKRIDLPAIGPETVRRAAEAKLAGIAVCAGEVLIADREAVARQADKAGIFVVGVERPATP